MTGISETEPDELQRHHLSLDKELEHIRKTALENRDLFGARMASRLFQGDLRSCLETEGRHDLLVSGPIQGFIRSLAQASDDKDFTSRLDRTIEFVISEKQRTETHDHD